MQPEVPEVSVESLRDDSGEKIDLAWLRDTDLDAVISRLGEPMSSHDWSLRPGLTMVLRKWWRWGGAVQLLRSEPVGPITRPIVGLAAEFPLPFTQDTAFSLSGLDPQEAPPDPHCTAEGTTTWDAWPGVGWVLIHYPNRTIQWIAIEPDDGAREPVDVQVFDLARYRAVA